MPVTLYLFQGESSGAPAFCDRLLFQQSMTWNDEIAGMQGLCAHVHILDFYVLKFRSLMVFMLISWIVYLES